jgi:hypothetical protein
MFQNEANSRKSRQSAKWLAALDTSNVQFLIVDAHRDRELLQAARSDPRWIVDLEDQGAVLLSRALVLDNTRTAA